MILRQLSVDGLPLWSILAALNRLCWPWLVGQMVVQGSSYYHFSANVPHRLKGDHVAASSSLQSIAQQTSTHFLVRDL